MQIMSHLRRGTRTVAPWAFVWALAFTPGQAPADNFTEARERVRAVVGGLVADVRHIKKMYETDKAAYYSHVRGKILPVVATDLAARVILAGHWKTATDAQRKEFDEALREMLIRSYGKALVVLEGVKIEYLPPQGDTQKKKQTVRTALTTKDNTRIHVDYVTLKINGEWKIFDLVIDGLSMVKQLRQSFDAEIQKTGLDALNARLRSEK